MNSAVWHCFIWYALSDIFYMVCFICYTWSVYLLCFIYYAFSAMLYLLCFICYALYAMLYLLLFIYYALSAMLYLLCSIWYALFAMHYLLCFICYAFRVFMVFTMHAHTEWHLHFLRCWSQLRITCWNWVSVDFDDDITNLIFFVGGFIQIWKHVRDSEFWWVKISNFEFVLN